MRTDKSFIQELGLLTQDHSETSTLFSCQIHVATEVLLDLGARPTKQLSKTRSGKQLEQLLLELNRLGRFHKPVRQVLLDLASLARGNQSDRFVKWVRPLLSRQNPNRPTRPKLSQTSSGTTQT